MPLYMDIHHHVEGLTAEAIGHAHEADVKTQQKYGVKYLRYWFDEGYRVFLAGRTPLSDLLVLVSGRASFELIQKALRAGVPILAAVGAPSSLAVELALRFGMTLAGFVRNDRCVGPLRRSTRQEPPPTAEPPTNLVDEGRAGGTTP